MIMTAAWICPNLALWMLYLQKKLLWHNLDHRQHRSSQKKSKLPIPAQF